MFLNNSLLTLIVLGRQKSNIPISKDTYCLVFPCEIREITVNCLLSLRVGEILSSFLCLVLGQSIHLLEENDSAWLK